MQLGGQRKIYIKNDESIDFYKNIYAGSSQPYKYQKYSPKQKSQSTGAADRFSTNFTRFTMIILWDWRKFDHILNIFDLTLDV